MCVFASSLLDHTTLLLVWKHLNEFRWKIVISDHLLDSIWIDYISCTYQSHFGGKSLAFLSFLQMAFILQEITKCFFLGFN